LRPSFSFHPDRKLSLAFARIYFVCTSTACILSTYRGVDCSTSISVS
jgi:hypothetical protein